MSQEGYQLFLRICDLYHVLLQVILFLVMWNIFYRPERERMALLPIGMFAAANVCLCLCSVVPGWVRYAASAAAVLGYCCLKYKRHVEKAVFIRLLFYNFHGMSFLISNSIYQFMVDKMLLMMDVRDTDYLFHMYKSHMIAGCADGAWHWTEKCKGRGRPLSGLYGYQNREGCIQAYSDASTKGNIVKNL